MNVSVMGCGRWGSFLAWYAAKLGHATTIWGRPGSAGLRELCEKRRNQYVALPADVRASDDLVETVQSSDCVLVAIGAQGLRDLGRHLAGLDLAGRTFCLCMKGLEAGTGKRLSEVIREEVGRPVDVAVWVGPGHVQEFLRGVPNCMVIDSENNEITARVVERFGSPLIRLYYGQDLVGNEVGAASKNVIGLAAGMLDGLGLSSLKGALMARGAREVSRLIRAMGGQELTAYGLSHLGDYEATLFSPHSHNRRFGEMWVKGQRYTGLAEGVATARALHGLAQRLGVELPICGAVHSVIEHERDPRAALEELFLRPRTQQF